MREARRFSFTLNPPFKLDYAPRRRSIKWFFVRLLFIAFFTAGGPSFAVGAPQDVPTWLHLGAFLFVCCTLPWQLRTAVCSSPEHERSLPTWLLRRFAPRVLPASQRDWSAPTWWTNPFSGSPQFGHMMSFAFMGAGAAAVISALFHHEALTIPLFPFAVGFGSYCGLVIFYRFMYDGTQRGGQRSSNNLPNPANPV